MMYDPLLLVINSFQLIFQFSWNFRFGAGSEFGREAREEARRKKCGIIMKKYKVDDQPWILKAGGKTGKKYVKFYNKFICLLNWMSENVKKKVCLLQWRNVNKTILQVNKSDVLNHFRLYDSPPSAN